MIISWSLFSSFFFQLGKTVVPKAVNEVKLISSGKILENTKTVGQCKAPFGEVPGGVIIMHVVVQPTLAKSKTGMLHYFSLHRNMLCYMVLLVCSPITLWKMMYIPNLDSHKLNMDIPN